MSLPLPVVGAIAGTATAAAYMLDSNYFISHDLSYVMRLLKVKRNGDLRAKQKHTFVDVWLDTVARNPSKVFMVFEGYHYTYKAIDDASNRIANWAASEGVKKGDVVALFMENRPEYVSCWMGLLKLGCVVSLLNYNVKGKPLVHSIKISGAKIVLVGSEVMEPVANVSQELLKDGFRIFAWGEPLAERTPIKAGTNPPADQYVVNAQLPEGWTQLDGKLGTVSSKAPPKSAREGVTLTDSALLVYTSGTTGLPKAATIKHLRLFNMGFAFYTMFHIRSDDRVYCVLPLYHSAGGLCGVGMTICSGATMVLRRKFSAREFFPDCRENKATVVQYIGELCRYLVGTEPRPDDAKSGVRIAIGNGLRPDVWPTFQKRFGIPEVGEFYGSTEGNAVLMNHCTTPQAQGSVGRMGPLLKAVTKMRVARFDVENEVIIRGKDGFAQECGVGQPGELLGEIDDSDPIRRFDGYHGNKAATESKIAKDVFRKGDKYFRTGDLLMSDKNGYWHFVDRIGDTFRWKGENVSTTEVAQVVSGFPGITEVNVYGVAVPGADGRACMAGMVCDDSKIDWTAFAKHCTDNLPSYAIPLFLRIMPEIQVTGTFKHQKVELRTQGADPQQVKDPLYIYDAKAKTYRKFTQEQWDTFATGKAKL